MDIELKDYSDLEKAYQGRYEGDDTYFRRISDEVKAMKGEYEGFGTYLRRLSSEAKARRDKRSTKSFPTLKVAVSVGSLAALGIGLLVYFGKVRNKGRQRSLF
jgi:hypothetical protein